MPLLRNALEYLEASAARLPDKTAFADDGRSFSFAELNDASRRIGTALIRLTGGELRRPTAVLVNRTAVTLAGFFGVLQAGCPYVPVDVKMPRARMDEILGQIQPAAILYAAHDAKLAEELTSFAPTLCLEEAMEAGADGELLTSVRERVLDIDPAYMIFTSGSTGKPKGILISHRALIDFTEWMGETCGVTEADVLGNQAPFYFDLSVKDIYQTLRSGCTTYILPKKAFLFPKLLIDALNNHGVTGLIWATSAFRMAADSGIFEKAVPRTVNKVILGGEALQARHLNLWKKAVPGCRFINLYGPTEVTVDCTYYEIDRDFADGEPIPIGKACRNMEIVLLDDELRPVPPGEPGELCVRGIGLALGYFGDPEKTAAAFVQNPLNPFYPDRLYRTGDIAKLGGDGNLYFLARKDDQIKHMGYRIELGEIETALTAVEGVDAGICFYDAERDYIVCWTQTGREPAELAAELKERVPKYMLPNVWKTAARLPINANGKIDRNALKERYRHEETGNL